MSPGIFFWYPTQTLNGQGITVASLILMPPQRAKTGSPVLLQQLHLLIRAGSGMFSFSLKVKVPGRTALAHYVPDHNFKLMENSQELSNIPADYMSAQRLKWRFIYPAIRINFLYSSPIKKTIHVRKDLFYFI